MRSLPSQRKSMSARPRSQCWGRDAGDEPLSSGIRDFWGGEEAAELDLSPWVGEDVSILVTSLAAWPLQGLLWGLFALL